MTQAPLFTLAFWFVLLPALWAAGSLAGYRLREKNQLFSGVLTLGLGLGVYAYFLILAGSFGWLKPGAVLCFLALSLILGWRAGMGAFRWLKDLVRSFLEPRDFLSRVCLFSLLGTFFFTALFCFLPEIANDALAIQLQAAKNFVKHASVSPSFYDITSYRPLFMSVLYSTGLLFQNVAIAKFFHWVCGVLLVSALAIKVSEVTQSKKVALFAGLMLWLTPTLMNQITTTYIDAGVALFIFLGYCVVIDALEDLDRAHFFYGGLLIGLAVGIRTLSLGAFFAIMVILGLRLFQRGVKKRVLIVGVCFASGVFLTSAYWFLRDWVYTGNPVYPYLGALFGTEDTSLVSSIYLSMGLPKTPLSFLMIPWNITFKPECFDYHHWVGPVYLNVLPFVFYAAIKIKKARTHLLFVLLLTIFWYFTGQNVRYLLPMLPVYLLAGSMGVALFLDASVGRRWGRVVSQGLAYFLIVFLLALTANHFRFQFLPIAGIWSQNVYLNKLERTTPAAEWANKNLPQDAKILILGEVHLYYFDREVILEDDFNTRTDFKALGSPEALSAIFKTHGITHILEATDILDNAVPGTSEKSLRPIELLLRDKRLTKPLTSVQSSNVLDKRCHYSLYELA